MASEHGRSGIGVENVTSDVSSAAVREQLERILSNDVFTRSERLSRFLAFVVRETLEGRQSGLKEYQVGVAVCGRSESYDQRTDPVVRVEARRLRSTLDSYYTSDGRTDPIIVSLPKGGYVPAFAQRVIAEPQPRNVTSRWWKIGATTLVAAAILSGGLVAAWRVRPRPPLTDKDTVVVAEFANTTGDPVFDDALRHGLAAQLEQSPFLNLLSEARVAQSLALMARDTRTPITAEIARQVCERTGSTATIEGSIAVLGGQYVLNLKAVYCHGGDVLAQEQVVANGKEDVIPALGAAASRLRHKLGESLASVRKFDAPPENVTTPSLEALQAYSLGFKVHVVSLDESGAAELFRRAVALDPRFAMAYARLATCYMNLGEPTRAAEGMRKAYELRERVSEHEKLFITSQYHEFVTGDLDAARRTYELRAEIYPHDDIPIGNLGNVYFNLGKYDKALSVTKEALRRNPGSRIWYGNLVTSYIGANQLQDAKSAADEAMNRGLDSPWLHISVYLIHFLEQDSKGMEREAKRLQNQPGFEDVSLYYQSQAAAYAGRINESRELSRRAIEAAKRAEQFDSAAIYAGEEGVREALIGNVERARQQARLGLRLSRSRDAVAVAALALGIAGDGAQATRLADDLHKRFPEDTLAQTIYIPMLHAAVALYSGGAPQPQKAIEALAVATPYELGSRAMSRVAFLTCYPAYLRGQAYLAAGQGQAAAGEFQKIINSPQLTMTDPIRTLTVRELARAYKISGDSAKSAEVHQQFLMSWRDADPSLPILK